MNPLGFDSGDIAVKCNLEPLKGKYYGSSLEVEWNGHTYTLNLWERVTYTPSKRELDSHGLTEQQWLGDELTDVDYWDASNGKATAREVLDTADGHYEDKGTYEFLMKLKEILEREG